MLALTVSGSSFCKWMQVTKMFSICHSTYFWFSTDVVVCNTSSLPAAINDKCTPPGPFFWPLLKTWRKKIIKRLCLNNSSNKIFTSNVIEIVDSQNVTPSFFISFQNDLSRNYHLKFTNVVNSSITYSKSLFLVKCSSVTSSSYVCLHQWLVFVWPNPWSDILKLTIPNNEATY